MGGKSQTEESEDDYDSLSELQSQKTVGHKRGKKSGQNEDIHMSMPYGPGVPFNNGYNGSPIPYSNGTAPMD